MTTRINFTGSDPLIILKRTSGEQINGNNDVNIWDKYKNAQKSDKQSVSKVKFTTSEGNSYNGTLTVYKDGMCCFETKINKDLPTVLIFKNEKDFKNKKIFKQINFPNDDKKRTTTTFNYDLLGHKNFVEITNADNKLISKKAFLGGKISKEETFDPQTGKVKQTVKHAYDTKARTETSTVYNDKDEIESTVIFQYAEDNKTIKNRIIKGKDGKPKAVTKYQNGKPIKETVYKDDNKKLVKDYSDENIVSLNEYTDNKLSAKTTVWKDTNAIKDKWEMKDGKMVHTISSIVDLDFKSSKQMKQGDCYLLSVINGLICAEGGIETLKKLINIGEKNGQKVYTVTLPGALLLKEGLKHDKEINPDKAYVTGTYTFTQDEFNQILKQAGTRYSSGNANVILLEAAFEKFREEVSKTIKENNVKKIDTSVAGKNWLKFDEGNVLKSGLTYDATFILTGQPSYVYMRNRDDALILSHLQERKFTVVPKQLLAAGTPNAVPREIVGTIGKTDEKIDELINKVREDFKDGRIDHVITVGLSTIDKNNKAGGHAFTVVGITDTEVKLINPWHPDEVVTISLDDFKKVVCQFAISEKTAKESISPEDAIPNGIDNNCGNNRIKDNNNQHANTDGSGLENYNIVTINNVTHYFSKTNNKKAFAQKDVNGNFRTMALVGESFKETMERLGITKKALGNKYEKALKLFQSANKTAISRPGGRFIIGKMEVNIPKELAEIINFEKNMNKCVMNPDEQISQYKQKRKMGI